MDVFFYIIEHNIFPVFAVVILGFALGKAFELNVYTLSKLNFYVFVPSFIFVYLYETDLGLNLFKVLLFCTVYLLVNSLIAQVIAKNRGYDPGMANAFKNSLLFHNTGNIGLSLITLVFSSGTFLIDGRTPYLNEALSVLVIILVFTNVTTNTLGFYYAGRSNMDLKKSLGKIFSMPSIYVIPLAFFLKYSGYSMPDNPLWPALIYLKNGLIPMALLTLGIQLSRTRFGLSNVDVHFSVVTRLVVGPLLALVFISLFHFTGVVAQTVFIAHSVPTAVNTALIAVECNNRQDFALQAVVWSTIFSCFTLTLVIYLARVFFPV